MVLWLPLFPFNADSAFGFVIIHALDFTALILLIGLILAFHRRFHDLAVIAVQRFRFDIVPLALLMGIVISGLALTADSAWLGGQYYWYISLTHESIVVLWLISLPFGKFFHLIERPATVGIELYWRTGENTEMQRCARCGEEFAPARFVQDLKKILYNVGENYTFREIPVELPHTDDPSSRRSAASCRHPSLVARYVSNVQACYACPGESRRTRSQWKQVLMKLSVIHHPCRGAGGCGGGDEALLTAHGGASPI